MKQREGTVNQPGRFAGGRKGALLVPAYRLHKVASRREPAGVGYRRVPMSADADCCMCLGWELLDGRDDEIDNGRV